MGWPLKCGPSVAPVLHLGLNRCFYRHPLVHFRWGFHFRACLVTLSGCSPFLDVSPFLAPFLVSFLALFQLLTGVLFESSKTNSVSSGLQQGEPMRSKKYAKMAAAYKACIVLHRNGELDDNLRPKRSLSDDESELEEEEEEAAAAEPGGNESKPGSKKRKRQYTRKVSRCIAKLWLLPYSKS